MLLSVLLLSLIFHSGESSPTDRIVGGSVAKPHSWPSQLSLQLDNSHICGAVVLNKNFALTAAHCVNFYGVHTGRFRVVCGVHDIENDHTATWQISKAADIKMHPGYNGNNFANDIALIRLTDPLKMNPTCQPAALPPDDTNDYAVALSTITGWGLMSGGGPFPQYLMQAYIYTLSNSDCQTRWGSLIRPTNVCVFDYYGMVGACNGDSGGPLFTDDNRTGKTTVIGLTSFGAAGCLTSYPSVYTRVSSYLGWIDSTVAQM